MAGSRAGLCSRWRQPAPEQPGQVAQAFGARRYAYNWALGQVRANLDAPTADPTVPPLAWNVYELRKAWN